MKKAHRRALGSGSGSNKDPCELTGSDKKKRRVLKRRRDLKSGSCTDKSKCGQSS